MRNYQAEKKLVRDYYKALDRANVDGITEVLGLFIGGNYLWRGFHPFNEQFGAEAVSEIFWKPFRVHFNICNVVWMFSLQAVMKLTITGRFGLFLWVI
jgi:hypothetical protein